MIALNARRDGPGIDGRASSAPSEARYRFEPLRRTGRQCEATNTRPLFEIRRPSPWIGTGVSVPAPGRAPPAIGRERRRAARPTGPWRRLRIRRGRGDPVCSSRPSRGLRRRAAVSWGLPHTRSAQHRPRLVPVCRQRPVPPPEPSRSLPHSHRPSPPVLVHDVRRSLVVDVGR
jgi:hypothetical protein